jgi:C4-dicarboxylate transporter DctM subunit
MGVALFILLLVFLAANVPVYLALILSSLVALLAGTTIPPQIIVQRLFSGIDKFSLMAVPFFIFAANIMNRGGLARRIVAFANTLVGHVHGGLAFTVILSCMFLGAVSGSAPATVIAICALMLPIMLEAGYGKGFVLGLIVASGSVAVIIPPSIGMVVYGAVTGTSVGELFAGGFIPGTVYGLTFMVYSWFYARRRGIKLQPRAGLRQILLAFKDAGWALGIPVVILGGIYGGICTPTEAAGIAVVYAIIVGMLVYREINWRALLEESYKSAIGTAQVMIILAGAAVFAWLMTRFRVPDALAASILALGSGRFAVLLMMNIVLLLAGMFLDPASIQMIMAPLFLPLAMAAGVHPVHLGLIMVVNGAIGMFTPPFGLNLFVASGVSGTPLSELTRQVWVWVGLSIVALGLITYIPALTMLVPNLLFRK